MIVRDVIALFVQMGCTLGSVPQGCEGPNGHETVRFLYNPETEAFVALANLEDDDRISPAQVENFERRLGMIIPKGNSLRH